MHETSPRFGTFYSFCVFSVQEKLLLLRKMSSNIEDNFLANVLIAKQPRVRSFVLESFIEFSVKEVSRIKATIETLPISLGRGQ